VSDREDPRPGTRRRMPAAARFAFLVTLLIAALVIVGMILVAIL
jgi:hypothetical protein